jgi:phospholipid/cholesterol/gamma-HCH transport system permease protein
MMLFLLAALRHAFAPPYAWRVLLRQIEFIGARSLLVIAVAGCFVGMVVALQFFDTLVRFGSTALLGSAVGLSLIRELGPVLTALILIGRAGSALCADIGIMRAESQVDALECMAIEPYRFLIAPRFLAALISGPLLAAIFVSIGILGGWFVGVVMLGVGAGAYFDGMADSVGAADLLMGLIKSIAFSALMVWICAGKGFLLHLNRRRALGSAGISRATTAAVVVSSIAVLFADYVISAFLR